MTLNEFAQGIEFLRIKVSFDYIKDIFSFLDVHKDGHISYKEFSILNDDNLHKMDFLEEFLQFKVSLKTKKEPKEEQETLTFDTLEKLSRQKFVKNGTVREGLKD